MDAIAAYHAKQTATDKAICDRLRALIDEGLPEAQSKMWHAHPVWFLEDNPIVGYSKLKGCVRLFFWSGQSFAVPGLKPSGTFKAAEARFADMSEIDAALVTQWLGQSRDVQWDYANIYKRKGRLERLR